MAPLPSPTCVPARALASALAALAVLVAPLLPVAAARADESLPALQVDVTNDADGDGTFTDVEEVEGAGKAVPFWVVVTNTTELPLTVTSLTDAMLDVELDLLGMSWCPAMAGVTIAPGGSADCTFTIDGYLRTYGPQPREELRNVVRAVAIGQAVEHEATDDSLVVNPNAGQVSVAVDLAVDADDDGIFADQEQAPAPATDVTFRAVVRNTSPGAVVVADLAATRPGLTAPVDLVDRCPWLDGMRLWGVAGGRGGSEGGHDDEGHDDGGHDDGGHDDGSQPGGHDDGGHDDGGHDGGHERPTSVTCTFLEPAWSPAAGGSRTATVTVRVEKGHSPERAATASDGATVTTPLPPPTVGLETRVGRTATGPFEDHDEAPGLAVSIPESGAEVFYEFVVMNTGAVPLAEVDLDATQVDVTACVLAGDLAPGATARCVVGPVTAVSGQLVTVGRVTAMGAGTAVESTDAAHYLGSRATLRLTVSADAAPGAGGAKQVIHDQDDADGTTVDYLFTVENTGEVALGGLTLDDDVLGTITLARTTLAPGETTTAWATRVVTGEDATVGVLDTAATASGVTADGARVTATASEQVLVVEVLDTVLAQTGPQDMAALGLAAAAAMAIGASLVLAGRGRRRRPATT